jgi:two-component system nitrogen regulation response regulator GlnG
MASAWIVDDDHAIRWVLERTLKAENIEYASFPDGECLWQQLLIEQPEVIISDVRMPGIDGLALMERIHARFPLIPIIIMTAHSDLDSAVNAYQSGAFEYLPKPFDIHEATALIKRAISHSIELKQKKKKPEALSASPEIIGEAPAMQEVFRVIGRLSNSSMSVLINGQSGTGKELVAKALHRHSPRKNNTFIALNMAAIPKELIEAELFGHEKGAFTGAAANRQGRFEQANGGTLFLDEIGDMPLDVQTRLLRVLADGQFYRVGGHQGIKVDVRIIAATHQDLEKKVQSGDFREDLFHRLNVIRLQLPALQERREDIDLLALHFLNNIAKELNVKSKQLTPETKEYLCQLPWPGNVRQLENICRWVTVMTSGQEVHIYDLPPELSKQETQDKNSDNPHWQNSLQQWTLNELKQGKENILANALP